MDPLSAAVLSCVVAYIVTRKHRENAPQTPEVSSRTLFGLSSVAYDHWLKEQEEKLAKRHRERVARINDPLLQREWEAERERIKADRTARRRERIRRAKQWWARRKERNRELWREFDAPFEGDPIDDPDRPEAGPGEAPWPEGTSGEFPEPDPGEDPPPRPEREPTAEEPETEPEGERHRPWWRRGDHGPASEEPPTYRVDPLNTDPRPSPPPPHGAEVVDAEWAEVTPQPVTTGPRPEGPLLSLPPTLTEEEPMAGNGPGNQISRGSLGSDSPAARRAQGQPAAGAGQQGTVSTGGGIEGATAQHQKMVWDNLAAFFSGCISKIDQNKAAAASKGVRGEQLAAYDQMSEYCSAASGLAQRQAARYASQIATVGEVLNATDGMETRDAYRE